MKKETKMPKCKGCQAEIIWIKTVNGKNMPCNAEKTTIVTEVEMVGGTYYPIGKSFIDKAAAELLEVGNGKSDRENAE